MMQGPQTFGDRHRKYNAAALDRITVLSNIIVEVLYPQRHVLPEQRGRVSVQPLKLFV